MKTKNLTPFPFGVKATSRRLRRPEMTAVVRATYVIEPGKPLALPETEGLGPSLLAQGPMSAETYAEGDDDRVGVCLYPGDFADWKPRAELMLRGTCFAPQGKSAPVCPVRFQVGRWSKLLRVSGRRFWSDDGAGAVMSEAAPFTAMPIGYESAFGGPGYARNPAGKGFAGRELPNVEHPARAIEKRRDDPGPAGFGPLSPMWPERSGKLGKGYGKAWRNERSPYFAADFDWSYFNAAPADQQIEGFLRGDEAVSFQNLHPTAPLIETRLPGLRVRVFVKDRDRRFREVAMGLDTLFADLDAGLLFLTWRGLDAVQTDDLTDLETALVTTERLDDPRLPEAHYQGLLEAFEADPLGLQELTTTPPLAALRTALSTMEERAQQREEGALPKPEEPPADAVTGALRAMLDLLPVPFAGADDLQKHMAAALSELARKSPKGPSASPAFDVGASLNTAGDDLAKSLAPAPAPAVSLRADGPPPAWAATHLRQTLSGLADARKAIAGQKLPEGAAQERKKQVKAIDEQMADLRDEPFFERILDRPPAVSPGPDKDLTGQDYEGQDLSGCDLSRATLRDANLTRTLLRGANLRGACLEGAVLVEADLTGADLTGADLTLANLTAARGPKAVLREARLDRAFLPKIDLSGAVLAGARGHATHLPEAKLRGADCTKLSLDSAFAQKADLSGADFTDARLTRCHLLEVAGEKAVFVRATITSTSFMGAHLEGALFSRARGERSVWMRANLDGADFAYAAMRGAFFFEASARGACFRRAILREARFFRASVERADFTESSLFAADFSKCSMGAARFRGANLYDAKLLGASGEGCDFSGANLTRVVRAGAP